MEMTVTRICALLVALAPGVGAQAGDGCFEGGNESGELTFSGVMEGAPFRGEFNQFSVRYCDGELEVSVATASASVGNRDGDRAMASEEFFHPEAWPEATWRGTMADPDTAEVAGTLTIRGIEREVPISMTIEHSGDGLRLHGESIIERLDFDIGTGEFEDTGFIANEVRVRFDLELAEK